MSRTLLAIAAVYRFVVGDPILLVGAVATMGVIGLLRVRGPLDGAGLFAGIVLTLAVSLALRRD